MLGKRLSDPNHVESGGELEGLGFLPMQTVFTKKKTRSRVFGNIGQIKGVLCGLSGCEIEGYEIHMGETYGCEYVQNEGCEADKLVSRTMDQVKPMTILTDEIHGTKKMDGAATENVYGTYVHGFFDAEGVVPALVHSLAERRGINIELSEGLSLAKYREKQYDLLAAALRKYLDMEYIYHIIEPSSPLTTV